MKSKRSRESVQRENRMRKLRDMGVTMAHIGRQEGLSRQRVQKILGAKWKQE